MNRIAIVQGIFFFLTGVWPLVSIGTFQAVTGPKTDLWLVKTVGILIAVIGLVLAAAGFRDNVTAEIVFLAVGSSASLMAVDVVYSLKGIISKIYLADAILELIIIAAWVIAIFGSLLF